ncbi:MAG: hypothetical protein ABFC86_00430, partial [Rectinema sp.]
MKKRYGIFVACLLILITVVPVFGQATKKQLTFLFMPGVQDPFYTTMEKGVRAKAKELGVNIIVAEYPKAWGPEYQVPILQAYAQRGGFEGLLIAPTSVDALKAPLK